MVVVGSEIRTIIANTADTLTLDSDWNTPPAAGDGYEIQSILDGLATLDSARGTLSLIDRTTGASAFTVAASATATALGLDSVAVQRNEGGTEIFVIENSITTVGDLIARIESAAGATLTGSATSGVVIDDPDTAADNATLTDSAAGFTTGLLVGRIVSLLDAPDGNVVESRRIIFNDATALFLDAAWTADVALGTDYEIAGAGLTLPTTGSFNDGWEFDVLIAGDGIVLVDRTSPAAAMTGTAEAGAAANELTASGAFASFDPDALAGRVVEITGGTGSGQSRTIVANTADTLTLESDWETAPDDTSTYGIANALIVAAVNGSGARTGLGLAGSAGVQETTTDTPLFNGSAGLGVRTDGTSADDITIQLSAAMGDTPISFGVDVVSLIDRAAGGAVSTFTVTNTVGGEAATDLVGPGAVGELDKVDVAPGRTHDEYVIPLQTATQTLGGGPLHGDTAANHLRLVASATPHIRFDMSMDANGGTGSGLYGPLAVDFSDLTLDSAVSKISVEIALETARFSQLWGGLGDPFPWMVGDAPDYSNPVDLSLELKPVPAIAGVPVATTTAYEVQIANLYDVRDGVELLSPTIPNSNEVTTLLDAVEDLTIQDVLDSLDRAGDYLVALQTESALADRLPGMSASISELFPFGDLFRERVSELNALPDELRPVSLQALDALLLAPLPGAALTTLMTFDVGTENLKFDLHLDLDAVDTQLPLTLDLTKLGLDLDALGLGSVAAIVDTIGASPLQVNADGAVDLELGIDLSSPGAPRSFLFGDMAQGSGTEGSFDIRAVYDDGLRFTDLFGSLPVKITGGSFTLDHDGD
jgi:hypothetical protein